MNAPLVPPLAAPLPCPPGGADLSAPDPVEGIADLLDRSLGAATAQLTLGIAPDALGLAFADWWLHLLRAPGHQLLLAAKAMRKWQRLQDYAWRAMAGGGRAERCIQPLPQDHRFDDPHWDRQPFGFQQQAFLLGQQWLDAAVREDSGLTPHHAAVVRFVLRQMLDMFAPSNLPFTNPVVLARLAQTGGMSLVDGLRMLSDDWQRVMRRLPPAGAETLQVGRDLAVTPGKLVLRNELIELLQYAPTTGTVRPEPVVIVPAWIMKYYILDLSPQNSLVRHLVAQGFTVFAISWRNPGPEHRNLGMDDYRRDGVMAALAAATAITGAGKVHGCGYCLGGTLLAIAAAAMARDRDDRFASLSFLAALTDFTEPGEIGLFIDHAQVRFLEHMMWQQGYLDSRQMGGAFEMLRSADLVWSRGIQTYLMGQRPPMTDLMAWNADGTRMPYAMHSQYLRQLFLENRLAHGNFMVDGRTVSLADIEAPLYILATEKDHVAPWRSVWSLLDLTDSAARLVLASGGHNGGVVSPPGKAGRWFRVHDRPAGARHTEPDRWRAGAPARQGSWWSEWAGWLADHSAAPRPPPPMGRPDAGFPVQGDAPGHYVHQH